MLKSVVPFTLMVIVECSNVGVNTLFKAAVKKGMSPYVYLFYSYVVATLVLVPSSLFFFYRTSAPPPLTSSILRKILLLTLIGASSQILGYAGINYSSPTLASALSTLVPAFTFLLAILFRMEKLDLKSSSSKAKIVGTVVSISGAFVATLYKGPPLIFMTTHNPNSLHKLLLLSRESNWVGGLLLAVEFLLYPPYYILQASILKEYSAELIIVHIYFFFATIETAIVSLIAEMNPSAWRIRPDIALISVLFSGLFGCVLSTAVHIWAVHLKGPFYVAMFKPFAIVIAVVMGVVFLDDTFYLGSLVGGVVISLGFYGVLWGKAKEEERSEDCGVHSLESSNKKMPLLQSK